MKKQLRKHYVFVVKKQHINSKIINLASVYFLKLMSNYLMSNFIHLNEMEIEAVNLALNINAHALQNAADIVQRQAEMKGQDRRRRVSKCNPRASGPRPG